MIGEHPQKILQDAIVMYNSRISVAIAERKERCRNAGMFVIMSESPRIVPDMRVLCLDRDQLLARIDLNHPTSSGALAMYERVSDECEAVFGVIFADGSVLATTLQVHDVDRDRRPS